METPTTKESPLFILKKFLLITFIVCCASTSSAKDNDLGTIDITGNRSPDVVMKLFWSKMHPHLKKGSHNYCHSKMADYPKTFYKDLVEKHLKETASESCQEEGSFDKDNRIQFDVHYDFDC
jgi:hypothetical protein